MFSPTTPLFFKILLPETLQNNKLWIPKKFVRLYGNTLSDQVVLKLPCGLEWKIGLKKNGDTKMWFENGWSKFVEFYSLKFGSLIVFRYNGNSKFETFIFDTSTVEIDYPTKTSPKSPQPKDQQKSQSSKRKRIDEVENSDDEIQIFEDSSAWQKAKEVSFEKRRKTSPNIDKASKSRANKRTLESPVRKISSKSLKSKTKGEPLNGKSKDSHFVIVIRPSYTKMSHPQIPANFNMAYMSESQGELRFSFLNGRSWSVQYKVRQKTKWVRAVELSRGWIQFVRGNNLNVGDVCQFELIKRKGPLSFKVSITRNDQPSLDTDMTHMV